MVRRLSDEEIREIRERVKNGESRYRVGMDLRIDTKTINYWTMDLPRRKVKKLTADERENIKEEYKEGAFKSELAKKYGVCKWTVYRICYGLHSNNERLTTGEEIREIQERHAAGESVFSIAKSMRKGRKTIYSYIGFKERKKLSNEDIENIRRLYDSGKYTKITLARAFGVSPWTIYNYTYDMATKHKKKVPQEIIDKIIHDVSSGEKRKDVALKYGVSYPFVTIKTQHLPNGQRGKPRTEGLTKIASEVLKEIMRRGFSITSGARTAYARIAYRELRMKGYPIRKVSKYGCVTLFVKETAKKALEALIIKSGIKKIHYNDSMTLMFQMGIEMSAKDRKEILKELGFIRHPHPRKHILKKQEIQVNNPQNSENFGNFLLVPSTDNTFKLKNFQNIK